MTVPSQMSIRQFPRALRVDVRVAYSVAWETLVSSHSEQAGQFIGEFASRVSPLEALELYFTVVPVSATMQEPIRTRTLATLDLACLPARTPLPVLRGWRLLRLDLLLKLIRFRRAYHEKTLELARMVGARAAEAITGTHVQNALDFVQLLGGHLTVERALAEYLRAFYLPLGAAQVVMQKVKAAVAGSHLAAEYGRAPDPDPTVDPPRPSPSAWLESAPAPVTEAQLRPE